jgi:hypothetical protein
MAGQPPHPRQFGHEFSDMEQDEIARKADAARQTPYSRHPGRVRASGKGTYRRWLCFLRRR